MTDNSQTIASFVRAHRPRAEWLGEVLAKNLTVAFGDATVVAVGTWDEDGSARRGLVACGKGVWTLFAFDGQASSWRSACVMTRVGALDGVVVREEMTCVTPELAHPTVNPYIDAVEFRHAGFPGGRVRVALADQVDGVAALDIPAAFRDALR